MYFAKEAPPVVHAARITDRQELRRRLLEMIVRNEALRKIKPR